MCEQMYNNRLHIEDIENIYVLGHSFGEVDYEYFYYLDKITRCGCNYDLLSAAGQLDPTVIGIFSDVGDEDIQEDTLLDLITLNIRYATHRRERKYPDRPELYPEFKAMFGESEYTKEDEELEKYAVKQRFLWEQAKRTQEKLMKISKNNGMNKAPQGCYSVLGLADYLDMGHDRRLRNAKWNITYYSESDRRRITATMKKLGLKRYTLYPSIDECISVFANHCSKANIT